MLKPQTKAQIIEHQRWHRLDRVARQCMAVGKGCHWSDPVWRFETGVPGSNVASLYWSHVTCSDGQCLTDDKWAGLLEELKVLVWSAFHEHATGKQPKYGFIRPMATGIYAFSQFLMEQDISSLEEVDARVAEHYCEWVVGNILAEDADAEVSIGQLCHKFTILAMLEAQSLVLRDAGHPAPRGALLDRPVLSLAREMSARGEGWIPPIPDEIALQLLESAERLLGQPAEDVFALQAAFLDLRLEAKRRYSSASMRSEYIRRHLTGYEFTVCTETGNAWHPPLQPSTLANTIPGQIRTVIRTIRDACIIVLQGCVGLRMSEVCGLEVRKESADQETPSCVEIRESASGLCEVFYLHGHVYKLRDMKEPAEWLLGVRPKGASTRPIAVRALEVLDKLYRPWRALSGRRSLIVSFNSRRGLPNESKEIYDPSGKAINVGLKLFAERHIDWSTLPRRGSQGTDLGSYIDCKGKNLRTHQWRKNFAQFIFRIDPRMTPAISRHFKHISLTMTEDGYIGNDARLLDDIQSEANRQTAMWFFEVLRGERAVDGHGADLVERNRSLFTPALKRPRPHAIREIEDLCTSNHVRIFFSEHGNCLISLSPMQARCHNLAGTTSWANKRPNFLTRSPPTCLGCSCFAIDTSHRSFWEERLKRNADAYRQAVVDGRESDLWLSKERAQQARAILKRISSASRK